ncbi:MAG: PAS domain S-box protein [Ignavibacteria bacterium]|nr:PAS domain S-box protein [Ignavibacteria bacterium]
MESTTKQEIEKLKEQISQLENQVREYKSFFDEVLKTTNVIIVQLDNEGRVILTNKAFEKITGYTFDEIVGKNWFEILVPKDKYPHVWEVFERLKEKSDAFEHFENPILTKSGEERYISWKNSIIKKNDEVVGTLSFGIDITENLYVLDQFVDQQRSYKTLIENLPGIIYRCKNDEHFTILNISSKCFNLTGYLPEDFTSGKISFSDLILEEDLEQVHQLIDEAIEKKRPFQLTYRLRAKDGTIKWVWEQGVAVQEKSDIILEGYIADITKRITAEEQLEIQRQFFSQLFENSPIGIVILDKDDKIIDVNKAFENLFYFRRDEVKGLSLNQLIVPPHLKSEGLHLSNKVLNDEIVMTETKRMRKDGSLIDVLVIGYPILHKGERVGIFGMYKDITEQKMMYELLKQEKEKIEELNQLKSNFLFNISHEIRTPLNSILGFSDLLISELDSHKLYDLKEFAESIKRGGMRLLNLMDNIIEISLIEASKAELNFESINISNIIEPLINLFQKSAEEKNLYLKKDYQNDFTVTTDIKRLSLVFRNILDNAIKFTNSGGVIIKIYVQTSQDQNLGIVEIIDTGIGISEKFMTKLFEPFTQESSGLNRAYEGIGLGLNLSKKLTELLGGKIEIESESNKGTTVRIILPL